MRIPLLYMKCSRCGKTVKLNRDRMGDLGTIQNQRFKTYDCPHCGNALADEIEK